MQLFLSRDYLEVDSLVYDPQKIVINGDFFVQSVNSTGATSG